jgi:hypothetical protein
MKKTYNTPQTKVVVLQTQRMIAESMGIHNETKSFSNSLSREGRSDWDDDEE